MKDKARSAVERGTSEFVTKDIDYTGCHPDIANALKQGKTIRCKLNNQSGTTEYILGYYKGKYFYEDYSTLCVTEVVPNPIQAKRILKDPVSIMKILVEEGWVYDVCFSAWLNKDKWSRNEPNALFSRFDECGTEVKGYPDNFYTYEEE